MTTWPGGSICPFMEIGELQVPTVFMKEGTRLLGMTGCRMKRYRWGK